MKDNVVDALHPSNFVDRLCWLATHRPDITALIVVTEKLGRTIDTVVTYAELEKCARNLAAQLHREFNRGDRVLLLLDNDDNYVVGFFACLFAGMVAVPVFPPQSLRAQHLARLAGIAHDAGAACALVTERVQSMLATNTDALEGVALVAVDTVAVIHDDGFVPCQPKIDDVAFLQYTSGSTSTPKGVMVTHANLMANERAIANRFQISTTDVFVSWLPLFHDMGLIGGLLQPFYSGCPVVLMTPQFFLEKPVRWLETISRHRGTVSGGPDFSFRLALERITDEQIQLLDLSHWRIAFSGAEPVRQETLQSFIERFCHGGFSASAVLPCYGLAEATLFVCGNRIDQGLRVKSFSRAALSAGKAVPDDIGAPLVSCGEVVDDHVVRIVDPEAGAECSDGCIGEIWINGPSVASGYWNRPDQTELAFVTWKNQRWLRTGDTGFLLDGELYVAGRIKDMIIVRGHNLFPQDIEQAVEAQVEVVRKGRVAAFAIEDDQHEDIGIAVELSRNIQKLVTPAALMTLINTVVSEHCGEPAAVVVLLNPGALPKTTSGKLQRGACKSGWRALPGAYALFVRGKLQLVDDDIAPAEMAVTKQQTPLNETEARLATLWMQVLRLDDGRALDCNSHFFACGGSSLAATQLLAQIAVLWNADITLAELFEFPQLGKMAQQIQQRGADLAQRKEPVGIPVLSSEQRAATTTISNAQRRQWILWRLDPHSSAYHVGGFVHAHATISQQALLSAFEMLAARHPALRTRFRQDADGNVQQLVHADAALSIPVFDLRDETAENAAHRQRQIVASLNDQPFDLTEAPPWRVALIKTPDDGDVIALIMHHIIADGSSLQIIIDELARHYIDRARGTSKKEDDFPQPTLQPVDYAAWQRNWLSGVDASRQLAWWRDQLGNEHPSLQLPVDHPRSADGRYRATRHHIDLPESLLSGLRERARSEASTLFMVLLAGFQSLLHRYTGVNDIRVGVPVANRHRAGVENSVGLFVNTQVHRNLICGSMTLAQVLSQTRALALAAQQYQDLPFDVLVDALQPQRSLSHSPLFQVMFNYLHEDFRALQRLADASEHDAKNAERICSVAVERPDNVAQYELVLEAREQPGGQIWLEIIYATELFDAQTIERMAGHYVNLLQAFAEQPELAVGNVELLHAVERAQVSQWSVNNNRYPSANALVHTVHHLFEQQAALQPQATAVVFGDAAVSYDVLNQKANQLAHHLIARGIGVETRVGVAMQRSVELVIALLAVLKAGATYVPLDPDYPAERLAYIIDDSKVALLLTQKNLPANLPLPANITTLVVDELLLQNEATSNPAVPVHGENLAYVIYTSGSTGKPKGAANRHLSLTNCMQWMQATYRLDATDTVLHKAPFGFDVSVWELFWPLSAGIRLVVAEPDDHRDPRRLMDLIERHHITTVNFVPAMLQVYLSRVEDTRDSSLKYIMCGGEAMSAALQQDTCRILPNCRLQNLYGPTETTIHVTQWQCRDTADSPVPIGHPIAGTQTWVLDADLNHVAQGVPGELYLGGTGLGRGYLGKAALTSERFVADPFDATGGRLYRTGDRVRWNADGQLEYLGRLDHQIKIRGLRIEPGEIEAQLLLRAQIREAIVVVQGDAASARLVAYVSTQDDMQIDRTLLRRELAQVLPDYMVPSAIVVLEKLPLSPNGKVERKTLPIVDFDAERRYEAPKSDTEQALAQLWARVLGVARVGRNDNFFDLGGNSLMLTQVQRDLELQLAIPVAMTDLFRYPTIDALADYLAHNTSHPISNAVQQDERAARQRKARLQRRIQITEAG